MKLKPLLIAIILPMLAGALFSIGLAPFKLWPVTMISIASWYGLLTKYPQFSKRISFAYGFGFFGFGISWIYFAFITVHVLPLIAALSIFCFCLGFALLFLVQGWLFTRFFAEKSLSILSFALIWMLFEWLRTWLFTGFPWLFSGYSMTDTYIGQLASIFSVYGVSFIVVLFAVLFSQIYRFSHNKKAILISSFALVFVCGLVTQNLSFSTQTGSLKVAVIQSNVDQKTKWTRKSTNESRDHYLTETYKLADTDVILWPEAALTDSYQNNQKVLQHIGDWATNNNTSLIIGTPRIVDNKPRNSMIATGFAQGTYDKYHLVPFGEYMPFGDILRKALPFLNMNDYDYYPGQKQQNNIVINQVLINTVVPNKVVPHKIGTMICYEAAYPALVRRNARNSELIMTVSNDDWFGDSFAPHQHLQMAQMRAIENRLSVVRSTQSGITAFIDPYGKISAQLEPFKALTLIDDVSLNKSNTFYQIFGHLYLMLIALMILIGVYFRKKESHK
ncbi:MAG: apolipoprotein N-acyltransferase [Saccharospirillaceae bacterium]|nr:apolipoprotein N-acyltransferase [Pseudomonadales bacterium]NRB81470.1 apolipoprotein N-acyltransferase [Saccharospirillaceae bacterium]